MFQKSRLDRLSPSKQGRYNSAQSRDVRRHRCNPNTRAAILTNLRCWSKATDVPMLYWMNGMAGTGKTTIAYTLSEALENTCQLGASFFCSRLFSECRDVNKIIPTIAYQLATFSYPFRSALCEVLGEDNDISSYDLDTQFDKLVRKPLFHVKKAIPADIVVVIDALDECSDRSGTKSILDLLFRHSVELPIKFFVTSRPEPSISNKIMSQDDHARFILILHDIEQAIVQVDIETYLSSELAAMSPPPSADQIHRLAEQAGNLFIYAATSVRYIFPENLSVNSHERLNTMLGMNSKSYSNRHNEIDILYTNILAHALEDQGWELWEKENIILVLHTAICIRQPMIPEAMARLLGLNDDKELLLGLEHLRSVIHVSESTGLVSALHASFPDYMLNQERSGRFFCDETKHHLLLAKRCFDVMRDSLRFNICDLESSYIFDGSVPNLLERIDKAITPQLLYACLHWGNHLVYTKASHELCTLIHEFLSVQLLFSMEVLNLHSTVHSIIAMMYQVEAWLGVS
jgi:hypothetical protein